MFRKLIVALTLCWPFLCASASSEYFYNTVTPSAAVAAEQPLATAASCKDPFPVSGAYDVYYAIAFEVNGVSYCGSGSVISGGFTWTISVPYGNRVKIRYATRDTLYQVATCGIGEPMLLFVDAPAMGISKRYMTAQGQWVSSLSYFRNTPQINVWNDLYDGSPPKGNYTLLMGCDLYVKVGMIQFKIN